jgi:hypothetical protein
MARYGQIPDRHQENRRRALMWRDLERRLLRAEISTAAIFPPAEQWLQRNTRGAAMPNLQDLRAIFFRFIDKRQQATSGPYEPAGQAATPLAIRALAEAQPR